MNQKLCVFSLHLASLDEKKSIAQPIFTGVKQQAIIIIINAQAPIKLSSSNESTRQIISLRREKKNVSLRVLVFCPEPGQGVNKQREPEKSK